MAANWAVFSAALLLSGALRGDAADSTDKNMRGNELSCEVSSELRLRAFGRILREYLGWRVHQTDMGSD
eukprot:1354543-Amorphochlora_amoeboformis.AAC.1